MAADLHASHVPEQYDGGGADALATCAIEEVARACASSSLIPAVNKLDSMPLKCYASDVAMQITTDAVQLLGGYGYTQDFTVERMMRDAKITQIYEGTNQIERLVMVREVLRR